MLKQYKIAEKLEQDLGSPLEPESILSFAKVISTDETEQFPHDEVNWLYNYKLQDYYVPVREGGKFTSFEEFVAFVRVLCRRDQTVGIAMTTLFWSFITWMAGNDSQKERLSQFIREENGTMCLGYSEKEHGSDLIGGDLTAKKVEGGYILNGEKWPINRATISGVSYILAKTDSSGGARCLSLFMVEKSRLNPDDYYNLPKILTHGIRASDMSGIGFKDCFVPDDMLIKGEGEGLEVALKGFQITRTMCAAFSHGAADTALRTTLSFALKRKVYEKTVFDIPQPRKTLSDGFLDLLISDCETISAARAFHVIPEQFSVLSAVVKYFVPICLERMINSVYVVLGSRFYMREEHEFGIFQKQLRDNSIISMFDGSSVVNLHSLILQLRQLTKYRSRRKPKTMSEIESRLDVIFDLSKDVPTFEPENLELFGRGADDSLCGLEISLEKLANLRGNSDVNTEVLEEIISLSQIVLEELNTHDEQIAGSKFEFGHNQDPQLFEIAEKYCTLHAAASCLHMWIYNRNSLDEFFAQGEWLVLALHRLVKTIRPMPYFISKTYSENLSSQMVKLYQEDKMFSIVPFQLAQTNQIKQEDNKNNASYQLQLQS